MGLVQLQSLAEMLEDHRPEFVGLLDRGPAGPGQHPVEDLVEPIDAEDERDAAIAMALDLLGGVPCGFGDEVGGVRGEEDRDVVGPVAPVDRPCVPEIVLEVEVRGDNGWGVEGPEGLEPGDAVGSWLFGVLGAGDEVSSLLNEAEAIGVEGQTLGFQLVRARVGAGELLALDQGPLHGAYGIVMKTMVGQLEIEDGCHPFHLGQQPGGLVP
jgi:hypothetical protein